MTQTATSERILFALKTKGALSARQIADAFGMSVMGAHKALNGLCDQGLVKGFDRIEGRGRPKRLFELSEKGHRRFPDNHADLTVEMLDDVRGLFGHEGLERLIGVREARQRARYCDEMEGDLAQRVASLARLRTEEGYMARVEKAEDGGFVLIEDHCPICAAAQTCKGFCRSELEVFRDVLGDDCTVEREEHLLSGGRRCTYSIRPTMVDA